MKNFIVSLLILLAVASGKAQNQGKAENVFNIEVNLFGASVAYEKAFTDTFVVKGEFGYFGFFLQDFSDSDNTTSEFLFFGQLSVEPKYYYNFDRRQEKGKRTINNAANYFSTSLFFIPQGLAITSDDVDVNGSLYGIVPKYGFRRDFGSNFGFEFAAGIGYGWNNDGDSGIVPALNVTFNYSI